MSTEQHEALELAQDLATCGATSADVAAAVQAIRTQHALIVQMAKALSGVLNIRNDSYGVAGYHLNGEVEHWDGFSEVAAADEAIAAATQYLTRGPKP